MSVALFASVGSTLDRIDALLAEPVATSPAALRMACCARQATELAAVVERLAGEEHAAGGRGRTLTALDMVGQALGELAAQLRVQDGRGEEALRVLEALAESTGCGSDRIAVDSGVPLDRVRAVLPKLELAGLAERCVDGWRQASHPGTGVRS